jgi:hypothetical protein
LIQNNFIFIGQIKMEGVEMNDGLDFEDHLDINRYQQKEIKPPSTSMLVKSLLILNIISFLFHSIQSFIIA